MKGAHQQWMQVGVVRAGLDQETGLNSEVITGVQCLLRSPRF